jgi:hypothetical protein
MKLPTKWGIVVAGQLLAVLSSTLSAAAPCFKTIAAARAMHGTATALYMTSILVLLVELSPKQHLALGIATLSAGEPAEQQVVESMQQDLRDSSCLWCCLPDKCSAVSAV